MTDNRSDSTSMSDAQLVRTLRKEASDIEGSLRASVNDAERQVVEYSQSVSTAEKSVPTLDTTLSGCGGYGGCGCLVILACGFFNSCGMMKTATADGISNLVVIIGIGLLVLLFVQASRPHVESSKLDKSKAELTSSRECWNRAHELRVAVDETCDFLEGVGSDDIMHDVYRARLEGLLEDAHDLRESLPEA